MKRQQFRYSQKSSEPDRYWLRKSDFEQFGSDVIRLTDITKNKKTFEGLSVILDLKGFTIFCDQRDPQHQVPRFLGLFIRWLFQRIRAELFDRNDGNEVILWSHLPIFGKFLGDGVLLIWDVSDVSLEARRNFVKAFDTIVSDYVDVFLNQNATGFTRPPLMLRCGVAQGQITSIADGNDYVGMCINVASRLQKLADDAFSFGFTRNGLEEDKGDSWYRHFTLIQIPIRGLTNPEFVYVFRSEFNKLPPDEQRRLTPRKEALTRRRKVR
jgi:class 3 adenylate cyclase